jgi:transcriptional regulator with XRE-family HTH domain
MHVGERLRELRKARGWTKTELARRAEVSRQTVVCIEREGHDYPISDVMLARLALALGVPLAELDQDAAVRFAKLVEVVS